MHVRAAKIRRLVKRHVTPIGATSHHVTPDPPLRSPLLAPSMEPPGKRLGSGREPIVKTSRKPWRKALKRISKWFRTEFEMVSLTPA